MISDKDNKEETNILKAIEQDIASKVAQTNFNIDFNIKQSSIEDIYAKLVSEINKEYSVEPKESSKAGELIQLTEDMLDSLSNERTNYAEFLARSCQLVVGNYVLVWDNHILVLTRISMIGLSLTKRQDQSLVS